ncbi:MAG: septum formation initiator family protein [Candidatus Omnitrophota bacterium]|jgi:cell division protein FtsB
MFSSLKKAFWLFGISVFLLILFFPGYAKLQRLREKNKELEVKLKKVNIDNALLAQELERVQNDPVYQEKIARDKMGIVRKGEIPIKIVSGKKR